MSESNIAASPRKVGLAVIVGNGFTLDFTQHIGSWELDLAKPLDWLLEIDQETETLRSQDALPHLFRAVDELYEKHPSATQFEILRMIVGDTSEENLKAEIEARHYLRLAFTFLDSVLWKSRDNIENWRWGKWLKEHAHVVVNAVSFNYEMVLERAIRKAGLDLNRKHKVLDGVLPIFKPHGSIDFDLMMFSDTPRLKFPLRAYARMNNAPLKIRANGYFSPPVEPLIVLPYESNRYMNYQWVSPGYHIFSQRGPDITHCLFIGLSYHPADRAEIDYFLRCTPADCCIIVANPYPDPDFVKAVEATNRRLVVWKAGPEPLP